MTNTKNIFSIRAIKKIDNDTVLVYRAVPCGGNEYEISVESYIGKMLNEISSERIQISDCSALDKFLLDICIGALEPCHLKNVIDDMIES